MKFRPCIDIHNGSVKQIVGGSLQDQGDLAENNFVSQRDGGYYGELYRKDGLSGGHIILLNARDSKYYSEDLEQAKLALQAFPGGLHLGGGVTLENAEDFLDMGASHVIVTSYVFRNGMIDYSRLKSLSALVGPSRLVLDLSCRRSGDDFFIVTDRWQCMTEEKICQNTFEQMSEYCDEFLVHAVDVEGKQAGISLDILKILARDCRLPVTYAGGIHTMKDIEQIRQYGQGRIDFTVGSALDLFGGSLPYHKLCHLD